jgi:hypothetical protein
MDPKFQDILDSLPEKPPRSRLELYGELIDELRHRGSTYRDIVNILAKACRVQVSISTLHEYVRARTRTRRMRHSARQNTAGARVAAPIAPKAPAVDSAQNASDEEIRRRIAAIKARKSLATQPVDDFHFDPTEPLRLITQEKPGPDQ